METFSVLNYQGSKKLLLEFIHDSAAGMIDDGSTVLDIFSGTCSVGYSYKSSNRVIANDSEYYAYAIAKALLASGYEDFSDIKERIDRYYSDNISRQRNVYVELKTQEESLINSGEAQGLVELYSGLPTIWNHAVKRSEPHECYELFTTYYAGTYFGIAQTFDIDSLRCAIEEFRGADVFYALLTSLFFAMKECVFSKDGHMAQPLDPQKNLPRLLMLRQKSIYGLFFDKLSEFFDGNFVTSDRNNKAFNMDFEDLLSLPEIVNGVDFIYADPPYTDMQYSRYYHLLNIAAVYDYPEPSFYRGNFTKGLYVEGRYQSQLSRKSSCLGQMSKLIRFSRETGKNLAISFAYPVNSAEQKTDRYVMDIDELINACKDEFTGENVEVVSQSYLHSNNRNSEHKKVKEYLILCKGR